MNYRINEGVRRAKAAWLCGHETISARVEGANTVIEIPLADLLSPKPVIEDNGPRGGSWGVIYRKTQRGEELPPIDVSLWEFGTPIAEVEVAEDELELFRQRYSGAP